MQPSVLADSLSNEEELFPMAQTKNKRDVFLIEIRKSKNKNVLQQKRMKLVENDESRGNTSANNDGIIYFEDTQPQSYGEITEEIKLKLQEAQEAFFTALKQQAWEQLLPVLAYLKDAIGDVGRLPGSVIIEMGIVPFLIRLLSEDYGGNGIMQTEVSWLLANISAGTTEDTTYLIREGIIPAIMNCLKNISNDDLHENVMWTLANIAGESQFEFRDQILKTEVIPHVARQLCTTQKKRVYYRTCAWLFANLVRGKPYPPHEEIAKVFMAINYLLDYDDEKLILHALSALVSLTEDGDKQNIRSIHEARIPTKVAFLSKITNKNENIPHAAMQVAGNLIYGGEANKETRDFAKDVLENIPDALNHSYLPLRKAALITLSHIYGADCKDRSDVMTSQLAALLCKIVDKDDEELRCTATFCLFRILENCPEEKATTIIEEGLLEVLIQNLTSNTVKLLENTLITLHKILCHGEKMVQKNQGYNIWVVRIMQNKMAHLIERLQEHPNVSVYNLVSKVIDFFPAEC